LKTAIFGGTFDPIHCAHLTVAREAADRFALDRVLFVPAGNPPHKRGVHTDYEDRYRMVELACAGEPKFEPSRIEAGQEKSYSIVTIERLRGQGQLFFITGADAFAEITTWHRWEEVVALVDFIVVTRPGHDYVEPEGSRVHRLDTLALNVSSSAIRRRLARHENVPELPTAVQAYVRAHRLYENYGK
jgi:nicotinate-nucleotide adenylyltransferase